MPMKSKSASGPCVEFEMRDVISTCDAKAQRYALSPLAPNGKGVEETLDDQGTRNIKGFMEHLISWRRHRINELRQAGWTRFEKSVAWIFAMNCPPVGVRTNRTGMRPCHEHAICPFCWARYHVAELYFRVIYALYGTTREAHLHSSQGMEFYQPASLDVLTVRTTWWYPMNKFDLSFLFMDMEKTRKLFLQKSIPAARGAYVQYSIEPAVVQDNTLNVWQYTQRVFALIPPFAESPAADVFDDQVACKRIVKRTAGGLREDIARAAGFTCIYPRELMTGPPSLVAALLTQRRGTRMSSYYGILRNKGIRKRQLAF